MHIRLLTPEDASEYFEFRRQALESEPFVFLSSPEDPVGATLEDVRRDLGRGPESVLFGAFDGALVGAIGAYREPKLKAAHRARIWRLYVRPGARHRGIGRALLDAALDHARRRLGAVQVHLGVSAAAVPARKLYESAGFRCWGTEPRWLRHGGREVDLHHMVLELEG